MAKPSTGAREKRKDADRSARCDGFPAQSPTKARDGRGEHQCARNDADEAGRQRVLDALTEGLSRRSSPAGPAATRELSRHQKAGSEEWGPRIDGPMTGERHAVPGDEPEQGKAEGETH